MSGGDPDSNRLMARILDKLDVILISHGFSFREECCEEALAEAMERLIFRFYEDETGGDSDYDPDAPPDSTPEEESCSMSLDECDDEDECC